MTTSKPPASGPSVPLNRHPSRLKRRVRRLAALRPRRLDAAICDIIDLRGLSLAVLLHQMPTLPPRVQRRVAAKIEDFLFFHPGKGRRVMKRLATAIERVAPACRPHLLSALADVASRVRQPPIDLADLGGVARAVLESKTDLVRKGKAVEILACGRTPEHVPLIIHFLQSALNGIEGYANYQFTETALFALKRLGGESLLRLLVNPSSVEANRQLRLEWRHHAEDQLATTVRTLQGLDDQVPAVLLKVIELSEYALPFIAMVREGLDHPDKWVRQVAAAALAKMKDQAGFEQIERMLRDPAVEVRLMAISSLGSYSIEAAGEKLTDIALDEAEVPEIRMNALYALYGQKNAAALATVRQSPSPGIATNAAGLHALLQPREEGLRDLLEEIGSRSSEARAELFPYLLELAQPDDLGRLLQFQEALPETARREEFLQWLGAFLRKNAGPALQRALDRLEPSQRQAIRLLIDGRL
ncbi:MAG: hypothetical protein OZSIB_1785 [Candidatus Ozemobacter sibiricus]|uniref:HEAT repeat domain-containing protein n=1 Tax=Candidatus Ozemobacter sibiricus TaxID=2268124 RepID=A0A367ZJ67_9BACT|nr:MAG: hypothetical protein OZSIB_1785 [Candidatus Ozemobacter sibiricus]